MECVKSAYKFGRKQIVASGVLATDSGITPVFGTWMNNAMRLYYKYLNMPDTSLGKLLQAKQSAFGASFQRMRAKVSKWLTIAENRDTLDDEHKASFDVDPNLIFPKHISAYATGVWRAQMASCERQRSLISSGTLRPTWPSVSWHAVIAQVGGNALSAERNFLRMRHGMFLTTPRMHEKAMLDESDGVNPESCPICGADSAETVGHIIRRCPAWNAARLEHLRAFSDAIHDNTISDDAFVGAALGFSAPLHTDDWLSQCPWNSKRDISSHFASVLEKFDNMMEDGEPQLVEDQMPTDEESELRDLFGIEDSEEVGIIPTQNVAFQPRAAIREFRPDWMSFTVAATETFVRRSSGKSSVFPFYVSWMRSLSRAGES